MSPRSPARQRRLLSAGYMTLDLIVRDLESGDYWQEIGGTCGNVSAFVTALGLDVTTLAKIGDDVRGEVLLQRTEESGLGTTGTERIPGMQTPAIVELLSGDTVRTHRFVFKCPLCAARLPKAAVVSKKHVDAVVQDIESYDAYFFDRATPSTVHLAQAARDAGLLTVFEPTTVPRTVLAERGAALSDIVKVSQQPSDTMTKWRPAKGASTKIIVETLGSRGIRYRGRVQRGWSAWRKQPAAERSGVRDTAGAGDWLTAGLLTYLLARPTELTLSSVQAALEYGQRLSALSLAFDGPHGALRELGAATIRQVPLDDPEAMVWPRSSALGPPPRNGSEQDATLCDLCLSGSPATPLTQRATASAPQPGERAPASVGPGMTAKRAARGPLAEVRTGIERTGTLAGC